MNTKAIVRRAQQGDEAEISHVHLNSWRESYINLLPQDFLENLVFSYRRRFTWWKKMLSEPGESLIYVAEDTCGIVGFSCIGPARDDAFKEYGELSCLYLLDKYKGHGIGYQLLTASFEEMKLKGFKKFYCWVLENNPTINFYEKTGARYKENIKSETLGSVTIKERAYIWE